MLAVIPARGASKGLPGKNIKALAGRPLIAYSIEAAHESRLLERVVVSTDDTEIA
ncbi:MAG: acylneuraminate cytidylyltransferase family protein, partial [Proteobacteria bacterium]|nr:acylneuraminate cytidylyltransferase family protein [Pseudomonadota bacterium]